MNRCVASSQSHDVLWRSEIWKENGIGSDGGWSPQPAQVRKQARTHRSTQLCHSLFSFSTVSKIHISFTPWLLAARALSEPSALKPRVSTQNLKNVFILFFFHSTVTRNDSFEKNPLDQSKEEEPFQQTLYPVRLLSTQLTTHAKHNRTLWKIHQSSCQHHLCIVYFSGRRKTKHLSTVQTWILHSLM